jgi:hypothetical protein
MNKLIFYIKNIENKNKMYKKSKRLCICGKNASFGEKNSNERIFCSKCKKEGMIEIVNRKCICGKNPSFGYKGDKTPTKCFSCKDEGMINIRNNKCKCGKHIATFGIKGNKATCCSKCKDENMEDLRNKKCKCNKKPSFGYPGDKTPMCCFQCKKEGMIHMSPKCKCGKQVCFGYINEKPSCCSKCKKEGMIDLNNKKCKCGKTPSYGYEGDKKPSRCFECKDQAMINIKHKKCITPLCDTIVGKKYKGYCLRCFIFNNPEEKISKNHKSKENYVCSFIEKTFCMNWIKNKTINGGTSLKRPDIYLDINNQVIVIEIDENQHNTYDCSCENKRLMEISKDISHRPLILIRFNPDEYVNRFNKKISSCWCVTPEKGLPSIKKSKIEEWNYRLSTLKQRIEYWLNPTNMSQKIIHIEHLFYDGFE